MRNYFLLMLTTLLFLTVGLVPLRGAYASPVHTASDPLALELIAEVNILRASKDLPPYQTNSILMSIAQSHAEYISSTGVATHFGASGLRPFQRAVEAGYSVAGDLLQGGLFSENIKAGKGLTVADVVKEWQVESLDLNTLLSSDFKDVGVGVVVAGGITYHVLDAGASINDLPTSSAGIPTSTQVSTSGTQGVAVSTNASLDDGTIYHIVKPNEALWSIALAYDTTIDNIKKLNTLTTDEIYEGQKLLIFKPEKVTATPEITITATFGIPTSTATLPVTPKATLTATPLPTPPTSRRVGGLAVGAIVFIALFAASIGSWLGRRKPDI